MDPSISVEQQKVALQLKFLISLSSKDKQQATIEVLNKLYPFTMYPLTTLPPLQYFQLEQNFLITNNLKKQLDSYCFIIILGKCCIQKAIYTYEEQKFIDSKIKDKLVFNLDEGETTLKTVKKTVILKIHNVWIEIAQNKAKQKEREYIKSKLIKVPFFNELPFQQFIKICEVSTLKTLGPNETLLQQYSLPYHMYIIAQGQLSFRKKVQFTKEEDVWVEVNKELQKKNQFCEELYQYLVRQPIIGSTNIFKINFEIQLLGQGHIFCAQETMTQTRISYSISSTLKTKIICVKYPDLYVLNHDKLSEIRSWASLQIDKKLLRKMYYYKMKWENYKEYLRKEQILNLLEGQKFESYLRKDVNLTEKKYCYYPEKIGRDSIIDSPAGKVFKLKGLTF